MVVIVVVVDRDWPSEKDVVVVVLVVVIVSDSRVTTFVQVVVTGIMLQITASNFELKSFFLKVFKKFWKWFN